ncbi:Rrf2 family transcriptional regulator [Flagellimonas alvinocaridis]|uniref:Rrf2 family transcriptional regulator n=1 Tax=Flagellimonas alvinocaridis TaxID=2530200 RepID=A0A4S8RPS2_9FLAO|nr:Rrf2 family transcriptional regulator [Allomuricauda alvinocaridis]THV56999.1 Rrf2 family transcriptional regulator [Allomuricauda alvinocaridis]
MLTNSCKYAIRAVMYLAMNSDPDKKVGVKKIASELEIPQAFLAQLLRNLTRDRLVSSSKGPGGGFFLDERNRKKSLWDVIISIDGTYKFNECFMGLAECDEKKPCPAHAVVAPFKKQLLRDFKDKTVTKLVEESEKNGTVISLKDSVIK